jgi:hypothetical protein
VSGAGFTWDTLYFAGAGDELLGARNRELRIKTWNSRSLQLHVGKFMEMPWHEHGWELSGHHVNLTAQETGFVLVLLHSALVRSELWSHSGVTFARLVNCSVLTVEIRVQCQISQRRTLLLHSDRKLVLRSVPSRSYSITRWCAAEAIRTLSDPSPTGTRSDP